MRFLLNSIASIFALIPERVEEILGYKLEEGESATINENFGEWFS